MAASERDGGRGGRWAAALASSFDDVVGDDSPGLTDTSGTGKGRGVRYKAAAAPNIATDGGRRTAEEEGAKARTEGPPSAAGAFFDGGAGAGTASASSSAARARVVASLTDVRARALARAGAFSLAVGAAQALDAVAGLAAISDARQCVVFIGCGHLCCRRRRGAAKC